MSRVVGVWVWGCPPSELGVSLPSELVARWIPVLLKVSVCVGDYCLQLLHLLVGTATHHAYQGRFTICQCKHNFVLWADGGVSYVLCWNCMVSVSLSVEVDFMWQLWMR